jgi:hypothetical protein
MKVNWKILSAMATSMSLGIVVTLAVVRAQPRTATLTPQDYIDIQQLLARYSDALDTCSNDGYDYADLYAPDGVYIDLWSNAGVKEGGIKWIGRDKLAEAAGGGPLDCKKTGVANHFLVNHVITPSPEGARGKAYLLWGRGPTRPDVIEEVLYKGDWYDDIYVKTPRGWKFKQRAHTRDKNRKAVFLEGTYPLGDARAPKK